MKKATRKQIKQHNQRLVLKSLYDSTADSRAALAQETGLTKPTVSTIVTELIEAGFVSEGDHGESTTSGGKRPRLLHFVPAARHIIAVTLTREAALGSLTHLDGTVIARHHIAISPGADAVETALYGVVDALQAQQDAPLLCLAVGVPGVVEPATGHVVVSPSLGWEDVALGPSLAARYAVPVYIGNNTEFATRALVMRQGERRSLVTMFISDTIEVGSTIDGVTYQHGADVTVLQVPTGAVAQLEWDAVQARLATLHADFPGSVLNTPPDDGPLTYLHIRAALRQDDPAAHALLAEIAETLAHVYGWIYALMRPSEIALAGQMSLLGPRLVDAVRERLYQRVPGAPVRAVRLTLAADDDLTLQGAVAHALHQELAVL
jgi:predicted NBD/HSP70 family sugar kinase